ncbi:MAG: hypothetical protein ACYS22_16065, partial [Planctomycetota bacterium]
EAQIGLDPSKPDLYEAYAAALFLEKRYEESGAALDSAQKNGSITWRTTYHRGLLAEATGDKAAAARYFAKAYKLQPTFDPALHRHRAAERGTNR